MQKNTRFLFRLLGILIISAFISCTDKPDDTNNKNHDYNKGLILGYYFDGNLIDQSPNKNDATLNGTVNYSTSLFNQAIEFIGVQDSYIKSAKNPPIDSSSFGICFWIKSTNDNTALIFQRGFVKLDFNSVYGYALYYKISEGLIFEYGAGGSGNKFIINEDIMDGNWHFIVINRSIRPQFNDSYIEVFVDTKYNNTGYFDPVPFQFKSTYDKGFTFGKAVSGNSYTFNPFVGMIDQFRIYDHELLEDEIFKLYTEI